MGRNKDVVILNKTVVQFWGACTLFLLGFIVTSFISSMDAITHDRSTGSSLEFSSSNDKRNRWNSSQDQDQGGGGDTLNGTYASNSSSNVKRIALLGERNSGTNFMTEELERCYPMVNVTPYLTRWKHWFQEDIPTDYAAVANARDSLESTIVIAEFRNVYDWIESMRNRPHNMPSHMHQDWYTFVTTAWTMPRPERDLLLLNDDNATAHLDGRICQADFKYNQVISCVKGTVPSKSNQNKVKTSRLLRSEYEPIYELRNDGSGLAYRNIIEMRRDKIINQLSVLDWDWVTEVVPVQYEKLLVEGTNWLFKKIEAKTGLVAECEPTPPQPERLSHYPKGPGFEEWVGENTDWEVEKLIGYKKW